MFIRKGNKLKQKKKKKKKKKKTVAAKNITPLLVSVNCSIIIFIATLSTYLRHTL